MCRIMRTKVLAIPGKNVYIIQVRLMKGENLSDEKFLFWNLCQQGTVSTK